MAYMVRGILFFGGFLLLCLQLACGQQTSVDTKKREMKSIDRMKGSYIDERLPKHGYYLQINHQNCHYEIRVNDLESAIYRDPEPVMSIRVPINPEISKSGTQSLSIRVFPIKGAFLSKMADLSIGLFYYTDMSDEENSYGELVHLLDWELPKIENEETPMVRLDTVFKATVPYEIKNLDHAVDLSKMDKDELLAEVVAEYKAIFKLMERDYHQYYIERDKPSFDRSDMWFYTTEESSRKVSENNATFFKEDLEEIQPIENYKLNLYAYGKTVSLRRMIDNGDVICKAQTLTEDHPPYYKKGEKHYYRSKPVRLYKDKRDNQWHIW
ncbi:conserved protein of unknown function [Tenacibaculum maritimum NCIMB 2154]|uniref:Uncharacterized protein n=2 Tax=Tenacibaculum maritimum TaxID=107401 RepID=A0A2H1E7D8_9FLAO|nr:conserved protein of unknown function [Tenacibaculum maritimum NCIMB 2154]